MLKVKNRNIILGIDGVPYELMDKLSDKHFLEELWNSGKAPWKIW